jgi:hypothetical protein
MYGPGGMMNRNENAARLATERRISKTQVTAPQ